MRTIAWLAVLALGLPLGDGALARELTEEERQELQRKAQKLFAQGVKAFEAGRADLAVQHWLDVLQLRRVLYPRTEHPDGHPELAITQNVLSTALIRAGQPVLALRHAEEALAMFRRLYPKARFPHGHEDLANCL